MEETIRKSEDEKAFLASKSLSSKLSLRSEMTQEIISRKSGFLEDWALFIFLLLLLLMIGGTWFVQYPDIINARATLTADNAPKEIIVRQEGRLVKLFAKNNEKVKKNEFVGWIESTANHQEVIRLLNQIDSSLVLLNSNHPNEITKLFQSHYNDLGEIQQSYQQLFAVWEIFNDYTLNGFYLRKKYLLEDDVNTLNDLNKNILSQKELTEQDVKLAAETYSINKILLDKNVITKEEFRIEKSKYVNKEKSIPQLEATIFANEMQRRDKFKEIEQLNHDTNKQRIIFQQALYSLRSEIVDWIQKYILKAPIDGKITYAFSLQENRFLKLGSLIGYVNPEESEFYVETILPQKNFGKIETGLKVQLRFDAYPYEEWGYINGTITSVSNIPTDSGFLAVVRLDKGLITNNQKHIIYKSGLKANAIIITKNMRLLEKFYHSFIKSTSVGTN